MALIAVEDVREAAVFRHRFERGAGIGDRDELGAGVRFAARACHAAIEIIHEQIGLERDAGFGQTMNSVLAISRLASSARTSSGSVESSMWNLRPAFEMPEAGGDHFRPQARSAHAEQRDIGASPPRARIWRAPSSRRAPSIRAAAISSQPSHLSSSAFVHTDLSRAHSLRMLPARVQSAMAASTAFSSDSP